MSVATHVGDPDGVVGLDLTVQAIVNIWDGEPAYGKYLFTFQKDE